MLDEKVGCSVNMKKYRPQRQPRVQQCSGSQPG